MAHWTLTDEQRGTTIDVNVRDTLTVVLKENPTTGYRWALESASEEFFEIRKTEFAPVPGAGVGGGGTRSLGLGLKKAATASLRLKLCRSWGGEAAISDRFQAEVRILP